MDVDRSRCGGLTQAAAETAIGSAGLRVGSITEVNHDTIAAGQVISQTPGGGAAVPSGTLVELVVSLGPALVTVPDVVGIAQAAAQAAITDAGLTVGSSTTANSDSIPAGSVISQNPAAGTLVPRASSIDLTISLGSAIPGLPPDPTTVAPPVDPTVATTVAAATEFLYTGSDPIQTGVAPGTIEAKRAAVLRGRVLDRANSPLYGVSISILNHPEFGQTLSRIDGAFDMAVNGGGLLTVKYEKEGFLPAQRQVNAPWQDYAWLPDVILIQLDNQVSPVDLTSSPTDPGRPGQRGHG